MKDLNPPMGFKSFKDIKNTGILKVLNREPVFLKDLNPIGDLKLSKISKNIKNTGGPGTRPSWGFKNLKNIKISVFLNGA